MFGVPDHDAAAVQERAAGRPRRRLLRRRRDRAGRRVAASCTASPRRSRYSRAEDRDCGLTLVSGNVLLTGAIGRDRPAIARALAATGREPDPHRPPSRGARAARPRARAAARSPATCRTARRRRGWPRRPATVDVLVANAALPATGELSEFTQEQIDRMLEVNLRAPIALAHALAPGMVARGRGHMVFISSLSGKSANPASSLYSATKFGLRGFALSLREDLRRRRRRRLGRAPRVHPRRRDVRRGPRRASAGRRHPHARGRGRRRDPGDRATTEPRSASRRSACGWAPRSPASPRSCRRRWHGGSGANACPGTSPRASATSADRGSG